MPVGDSSAHRSSPLNKLEGPQNYTTDPIKPKPNNMTDTSSFYDDKDAFIKRIDVSFAVFKLLV